MKDQFEKYLNYLCLDSLAELELYQKEQSLSSNKSYQSG